MYTDFPGMSPVSMLCKGSCTKVFYWAVPCRTLCSIIHCHTTGQFSEIHPQPCSLYGPGPLASGGGQTLLSAEVSGGGIHIRESQGLYLSVSLCSGTLKIVVGRKDRRQKQVRGQGIGLSWRRHRLHFRTGTAAARVTWPETVEGLPCCAANCLKR